MQVQLLRANAMTGPLLQEVDRELGLVWRFILEREVEAPERFQAIQSYRATMAVLRKQANFVAQLFDSGVVDDVERDELLTCAPLNDRKTRVCEKVCQGITDKPDKPLKGWSILEGIHPGREVAYSTEAIPCFVGSSQHFSHGIYVWSC